ncbi:MAG TPA: aldehyde dehydrogenase family protein [Pyrinomonadaceae bacterium]|nr:aldehyde dehydrogenase family protein [Chloracidobacterium sp.]HRJ90372.1 aldehyde dehydrogenase family protein [Pyrinomonadaceae bacterium]HRK52075.1 aldehyde dehydrogenase family protein [Pyrinomonadaceae bacterium]
MGDKDLIAQQEARDAVEAAHRAFAIVGNFGQEKIDEICGAMAGAALADGGRLGRLAHEETGFGNAEDKREKNRFAAEDVWNHFRTLKTVGVIRNDANIVEIASPRGVVAAIIPSTNPTSTAIFKIIIAIKSRNTIVLSPHPSAASCIRETTRVMRDAAIKHGLPADAIYCIENPTIEGTEALMKHRKTAVILATGGIGLVRAAYSSGKPAFGVGPGNVPVFIERSANVSKAVADILTGTCFDNGTICASEQSVVVDRPIEQAVRDAFRSQGGHFLSPTEADSVARVLLTDQRTLNPAIVGRSAEHIAGLSGITIPPGTRCLIADCVGVGRDFPWSIEKLSPTLAFFVAEGVTAGAERCQEILQFGGMGHTAGMHTNDRDAAIRFGEKMPASRVIINSPTTHGAIGLTTDLAPSMTLGCGSWGGNVTSDNVSPIHLMDIKRVAFETKPVNRPLKNDPVSFDHLEMPRGSVRRTVKREEIASIVDKFLSSRIGNTKPESTTAKSVLAEAEPSPVKTIIHELRPQSLTENGSEKTPVDFVSENDVRAAMEKGEKIFIHAKTILTPSARDLGEEKEIFART